MTEAPRSEYRLRNDTASEAERPILANIFRFVLDCQAKKEAAPESRPDAGKEIDERSGNRIIRDGP